VGRALYVHHVPTHDFDSFRAHLDLPSADESDTFSSEVLAEAQTISAARPVATVDLTDLPFVTIDPSESLDLDQAVLIARNGEAFTVRYAIADLGSAVPPGGAVDAEARRRGETIYLPDGRIPLHPPVLSESALSLLPDQVRGAAVWTIEVAADGSLGEASVQRALVRSVARLDYATVQTGVDTGTPHPSIEPLADLGRLRRTVRLAAGAIDLALPAQEVVAGGDGWTLRLEPRTDADGWNAEISLLTGMAAARLMLDGGVGLLRTLPKPAQDDVAEFMHVAAALGIDTPPQSTPGELLASLDPAAPATLALMTHATALLRGAGYAAFDGKGPEEFVHAGVGGAYAHVTAPLRRLADRFGTEVCLAICADDPIPDWTRSSLPEIAEAMLASRRRSSAADREAVDLVETWVMQDHDGATFDAIVVRAASDDAAIFITDPPIEARCEGAGLVDGSTITVRVHSIDADSRTVTYAVAE